FGECAAKQPHWPSSLPPCQPRPDAALTLFQTLRNLTLVVPARPEPPFKLLGRLPPLIAAFAGFLLRPYCVGSRPCFGLARLAFAEAMAAIAEPTAEHARTATPMLRPVAAWLLCCCGMIFAMVVIGGITRLTL